MFNKSKEAIKKNIKSNLKIKDLISEAKASGIKESNKVAGPAVLENTSKKDFMDRYFNIFVVQSGLLLFMIITATVVLFNIGFMNIAVGIMSILLMSMFYFKYSFISWRARQVFIEWENRQQDFVVTTQDYLDFLSENPLDIFPKRLKNEK